MLIIPLKAIGIKEKNAIALKINNNLNEINRSHREKKYLPILLSPYWGKYVIVPIISALRLGVYCNVYVI